jgi:ABC-type phosphate/phosphonate transport system substrate-binding protein
MKSMARVRSITRRALAALALLACTGAAQAFVLAVNEGVTYRVGNDEIRARYAAIAADLSKIVGQTVRVEPIADYPTLRQRYDLALVHPAHISIQAIKRTGWQLVAVTKGFENYSARFLVRADSPLKTLADLRGGKLGAPDEDSSWMVRATMRDVLGAAGNVQMTDTRYQDAVPFMVQHTFTQSGATASNAVVKAWEAAGGKVLARSKAVPIKHVIAGPGVPADVTAKLRDYFVGLDGTEAGRKKLEAIKVQGYMPYDTAALMALGAWLGI